MNYKSVEQFKQEEDKLVWLSGAQFKVKADISTDSCVDNGTKWRHHLLKWYGINSYQTRRAETPAQNTRRTQATGSPACFAWRNA